MIAGLGDFHMKRQRGSTAFNATQNARLQMAALAAALLIATNANTLQKAKPACEVARTPTLPMTSTSATA